MNAERLLAHFERISEAPDAIARLRRFILDLAVRGKLVEQDPEDEPAEELLKRIAVEKVRLVKEREIKRGKVLPPIEEDKLSFDLPSAWAFTRLGDLIHLVSGQHLQPHEYTENSWDGLPYITGPSDFADEGLRISRFALVRKAVAKKGQLLLTVKGSGVGKATTCNLPEVAISRQIMALMAIGWDDRFLILIAHRLAVQLRNAARSLIPGISREDVEEFAFPLPPLAEQHRIVAKVDELMALCDQLEAARQEREQRRERLMAATLQRLNQPAADPASFRKDASFALQVLPSLTTTPAQIKQLRQTILNLAVRGKLVEQDPEDAPAEELLKAISLDSSRSEGRRAAASPSPVIATEGSFVVPDSWVWTLLGGIGDWGSGSTPPRGRLEYYGGDISWYKSGELSDNKRLSNSEEKITRLALEQCSFRHNKPGDVLIAMYGATIGRLAILAEEAVTNQAVCACTPCWGVDTEFLYLFLLAKRDDFRLASEGGAQPNISKVKIVNTVMPLPPLAEQHRIVAKVDELMALCDQLEQQLSQTDQQRRRLLEAVLAEALLEPEQALAAMALEGLGSHAVFSVDS
jgi:type I restriction enzyme, S subunit